MPEFQVDDTINNRYRVLRKLGAGAMGSVYLCEDGVENRIKVALKVLISENLDDQDVWAKGEYEALTRLRHPNLARVYNFGRIEGTRDYFIVSEFIKGIDLFTATEYLNYEELIDIFVQICRALEYIHSQGYVHFDIKPDNILVTRHKTVGIKEGSKVQYEDLGGATTCGVYAKPSAKLIDFGLAEKITGSFSFAIKGTLNYLAPEILNGSTPDKRADLYSLGVTLYQCVNRDLPFYQDFGCFSDGPRITKRSELFEFNMKKHPEFLRNLVMRLLEEDPDRRFQSAREAIQYINRCSEYEFELETAETKESYFFASRLVGRKKEMNLLKRLYESAFHADRREEEAVDASSATGDTRAQLALITGEIGAGKSRLLEEFQHFLKLNDINVYTGNCYEANNKAYQPFLEILRQVIFAIGPTSELFRKYEDYILRLLPEFDRRKNGPCHQKSFRPEKEKHYFIEKIAQLLVEAAERSPYAMVVNNLHWIDEASADLLEKFLDRLLELGHRGEPARLLALFSERSEEQSAERVKAVFGRLKDDGLCVEVPVRRLKPAQIGEFLKALLGFSDVPEDFVEKLEEQTGGNPLFLVETLKALVDEGIVKNTGGEWSIKTSRYSRVEIPQRMEDLLLKRLDRLDGVKRELLAAMAVLDKPVSPKFLQRFEMFSGTPTLVHLRDLEATGIVKKLFENGKLHFEIEQPKVREIVYSHLEEGERQRLHGAVGVAYEEVYRHREDEILEELAYHYQRSDRAERAMELALKAGDRLKAIYANDKAYEYYSYVLRQVEQHPECLKVYSDTCEKLGEVCTIMGRYDEADDHYTRLLSREFAEMLPVDRVASLHLRRGKVFEIQGDYEQALKCYKDARNCLSGAGARNHLLDRARVYNAIGWVYVCMGKYEKAMAISLEALRVIERLPEGIEHSMVFSTIGSANFFKGNVREAIKYHRRSLEIKEHLEDMPEISISLNNLGSAHLEAAEYGEADEHFRRALAISEETGDPYGQAMSLHSLAKLHHATGQDEEARRCLEDSLAQSKSFKMRYLTLQNYTLRGVMLREEGDYTKAEANLFRALTAYSKQGNRASLCATLLHVCELHRLSGNRQEAWSMLEEAGRYAEDLAIHTLTARGLLERARLVVSEESEQGGDLSPALECLRKALALSEKIDSSEVVGEIHYELGEALVCQREISASVEHYRRAEECFREVLDNLPERFRESYESRLSRRFPGWRGGRKKTARPARPEGAARSQPERRQEGPPLRPASPENAVRQVNELTLALPRVKSLPEFLAQVLDGMIRSAGAEIGLVLSLSGRNLSVLVSRDAEGNRRLHPERLLSLGLIHRTLRSQQPLFLERLADEPSAQKELEGCDIECRSLAILPFVEPDGDRRGAVYLLNPQLAAGAGTAALVLLQPFVNLLPLAQMHFAAARAEVDAY